MPAMRQCSVDQGWVDDNCASAKPDSKIRRRLAVSGVSCLIAVAALLVMVPTVPATWANFRHWGAVTDGAHPTGQVSVTGCARGSLQVNWRCRGTFRVDDPLAEPTPSGALGGVVIVNDFHRHPVGSRVGVALRLGTRRAYLWGDEYAAGVVGRLAGALLSLIAIGLAWPLRRRRSWWAVPASAVIGASLILVSI
jgi:hypothetical protein